MIATSSNLTAKMVQQPMTVEAVRPMSIPSPLEVLDNPVEAVDGVVAAAVVVEDTITRIENILPVVPETIPRYLPEGRAAGVAAGVVAVEAVVGAANEEIQRSIQRICLHPMSQMVIQLPGKVAVVEEKREVEDEVAVDETGVVGKAAVADDRRNLTRHKTSDLLHRNQSTAMKSEQTSSVFSHKYHTENHRQYDLEEIPPIIIFNYDYRFQFPVLIVSSGQQQSLCSACC